MTPILVRPVREQLEHDRVIRLLQVKWRRKYAVAINQGAEQTASVTVGDSVLYPDVLLTAPGRARKPEIIVEVETAESVNNLEAMAEWARLAQVRAEFHLYVPAGSVSAARRLCEDHHIHVDEICTYHPIGDEIRFASVFKAPPTTRSTPRREEPAAAARKATPRRASGNGTTRKTAVGRRAAKTLASKRQRPAKAAAKSTRAQKRK